MKYITEEIEYNKLFDPLLADREVDYTHEIGFTTYIVDEKELQLVKKTFDIIFTNEIEKSVVCKNFNSDKMQIASIAFPSELVNFIKGFKSINDKKKFIDQFRLNALLHIFDEEKGHYGLRDFFHNDNDVLNLKDFFSRYKAKIIDFLYVKNIYIMISLVEIKNENFIIEDVDDFIEKIAHSIGMTRHAEFNTFVAYEYSTCDYGFLENIIDKYFSRSDDGTIEGKLSELICFIEDVIGIPIPKRQLEFLSVFSLYDDDFEKYWTENEFGDSRYFLEIEKNTLFRSISGYDINPLFLMYGNMNDNFEFKILTEYVEMTHYKASYRWEKQVDIVRNIVDDIREITTQSSHQKGKIYEKHVIKILKENYGYILEEHTGGSGDGGVDLIMIDTQEKRVAIQCKFSSKKLIGSRVVGEIYKGKDLKKADYGMICSNRAFSSQCQDEACELGIKLERIAFN